MASQSVKTATSVQAAVGFDADVRHLRKVGFNRDPSQPKIRAELANAGTPIGSDDLQIAAIALANNMTLVTHNVRQFERIESLPIEAWEVPA